KAVPTRHTTPHAPRRPACSGRLASHRKDQPMARQRRPANGDKKDDSSRRLVVVVAFDVVNFSALVEADEERALAAWRALRRVIDPVIVLGGGRIFNTLGAGLLGEVNSSGDPRRPRLPTQRADTK